jgi:hypothetical protein
MPSFTPQYKQKPRSTPAPVSEAIKARIEESKRLQQVIAPQVQPQVQPQDDVGWTEVRRNKRKVKRELTLEEMDARERGREAQEDGEFNTQLFESNRHDHDRV